MSTIEELFSEFRDEADIRAQSDGNYLNAVMFEIFAETAEENGDVDALAYTPCRRQGIQIDGYHLDEEAGILTIAVADFRPEREIQSLNAPEIRQFFRRAENFIAKAVDPAFVSQMEETSHGFQVAFLIAEKIRQINRIKFLLLSNARLASRLTGLESKEVNGHVHSYHILDFSRYFDIQSSRTGQEPIEVDIVSLNGSGLPCLPAHAGSSEYEAYLIAMPGQLLAKIYSEYGARLLEQNVRTFLQARGKVNRGIIATIKNNPEMFFAYNNGLTATASDVTLTENAQGIDEISAIRNLQIVNGGQTTASILYARDKEKCDLSRVFVQVKLSVVAPESINEVVPNISRFANTQNRVSEADFFSNHPFHVRIEEFSRRLAAPPREGQFTPSKWFYERARGQYRDAQSYLTDARRRQFLVEFPKDQVIAKTDLAKYEVTFDCEPHLVSQGAQKNFIRFADRIAKLWEKDDASVNEAWYRSLVAKAIVFRRVDQMVMKAEWYEGGYKANIVTYSIAWLINHIRNEHESELDLDSIWKVQDLPPALRTALEAVTEAVAKKIVDTPQAVRNVTEWCKQQACWNGVSRIEIPLSQGLRTCLVDRGEIRALGKDARKTQGVDTEIRLQSLLVNLAPEKWAEIQAFSIKNRCFGTPQTLTAIDNIKRGEAPTARDTRLLGELFGRLKKLGYTVPGY